jgi:hypothetical protein
MSHVKVKSNRCDGIVRRVQVNQSARMLRVNFELRRLACFAKL